MKKLFSFTLMAAAIAAVTISCNKVEEIEDFPKEGSKVKTLVFAIGDSETTKTVIGETDGKKFAQWETGDVLGSITTKTSGSSPVNAAASPVTFSIASEGGLSEGNTINVWYPYGGSVQSDASAVAMSIPNIQTQDGSDFDFDAMPMVAETITVTAGMESATDNTVVGTINFANLGSLIDFKVYSTNATYAEEKVLSVKFAANKAIAGDFTMDLTAVDFSDEESLSLSGYNIRNVYTALAAPSAIGSTKETALDVYMVVAPGTYQGSVVVETNKALYTFPITSDKVLARSGLKSFGLNLGKAGLSRVENVATLDWESVSSSDEEGLGKTAFGALTGVISVNAGSDYAAGNKPFLLKFDDSGRYIVVKVDDEVDYVTIKGKGFNAGSGSIYSSVAVQQSVNGVVWTDVQSFNVNSTSELNFTTTSAFSSTSRFVRLYFTKAKNNFAIARVAIYKPDTNPVIAVADIEDVPAIGDDNGETTYTVKNFADDVEVTDTACDGCVTAADAGSGTILYEVAPNYTASVATGHIYLWSASDHSITKTINVSQLASSLTVSAVTVTIPAAATSATFTVTTPDMGYNTAVTPSGSYNLTISSGASGSANADSQTITVSSTTAAPTSGDPITLGTIDVYRNGNTADPQKVTVTIKKAVAGVVTYSYHLVNSVSEGNFLLILNNKAISAYDSSAKTLTTSSVTIDNNKVASNDTTNGYAIAIESVTGNHYTLKMGDNYIGYANDGTKIVISETIQSDYYKWDISIDGGAAYIVNVGKNTRYIGAANSNGDTFKAYATSNHATYPSPFLYKYQQD